MEGIARRRPRPQTFSGLRKEHLLAGLIVLLLLAVFLLPGRSFWAMDEGNRYLQVVSLSRSGLQLPPPIPYPGSELLPPSLLQTLKPLPYHYGTLENGRLYSQYNPLMALLSLPGYFLLGRSGIYLIPLLAGALLVMHLSRRYRRRGWRTKTSFALALLATPIVFYSLTFWSHTLALLLGLIALDQARRGSIRAAIVLTVLSVLLREEMLLLIPLIILIRPRVASPISTTATALGAVAFFLLAQRVLTGTWLGTHLAASGTEQAIYGHAGLSLLSSKLYVAARTFFSMLPGVQGGWALPAGLGLWGLWGLGFLPDRRIGRVARMVGMGACAAILVWMLARGARASDTLVVKHPLLVFPVLWLCYPDTRRGLTFLGLCLLVVLALSPMHVDDLAWGLRHTLLPVFFLSLGMRKDLSRPLLPPVLVLGGLALLTSISLLTAKRVRSAELLDLCRSTGSSVITTSWEQPQDFATLIEDGVPVLMADRGGDLLEALRALSEKYPVVVCRSESADLAIRAVELSGMRPTVVGRGYPDDPLLDVVVVTTARHR
ncbi:hypothetical protein GF402_09970 [Candidatus Fermentibacteria bacterium]|nr:hypothetical protein [Candidatus Fermentibacteria bacterium]